MSGLRSSEVIEIEIKFDDAGNRLDGHGAEMYYWWLVLITFIVIVVAVAIGYSRR